ncbi:polysaccharide pyruvyl transferase family protein [Vibrio splendidus]|uniref:polysaccharide pyruvyl transferase family protein n=1 Tax=Vibrio splendidus TaxID=29497 RepID=UPI00352D294E
MSLFVQLKNKTKRFFNIGKELTYLTKSVNELKKENGSILNSNKKLKKSLNDLNTKLNKSSENLKLSEQSLAKLYRERKHKDRKNIELNNYIDELRVEIKNNELRSKKTENIILTTYPERASRNVGDAMITESFVKLMKSQLDFEHVIVYRETPLEKLDLTYVKNIFLPGMSLSPGTYPNNYKFFDDLDTLNKYNVYPVGCSFQSSYDDDNAYEAIYKDTDKKLFSRISREKFPLLCRDEKMVELLSKNNLLGRYFGDLVLYDSDYYGKVNLPKEIKSIAFSVQHNPKFNRQSVVFLNHLREYFPSSVKIFVTFHSEANANTDAFIKISKNIEGIEYKYLSGPASNLEFYDSMDIHFGYRLHGHISFLRRRKPSVLLVEDIRAYGISCVENLNYGMFLAMDGTVDSDFIDKITKSLFIDIESGFENYKKVSLKIDNDYDSIVLPVIKSIAQEIK